MLIKEADDRTEEVAELTALLTSPELTDAQRVRVGEELRNFKRGIAGEKRAAHYLNIYFSGYKNTIILHDLQFVLSNKTAHIDHLVIGRYLDIYVLESKNWSALEVDATGACTIRKNGQLMGVESPLEQCRRHAKVLERVFQLDPELKALAPHQVFNNRVLLAPRCYLKAPQHTDSYMKSDAFHTAWDKEFSDEPIVKSLLSIPRTISREKLIRLGERLKELHDPRKIDWRRRLNLPPVSIGQKLAPNKIVASIPGLADYVPRSGQDWFVLHGKPTEETKKAIRSAGYRAKQENGEWVWRLRS